MPASETDKALVLAERHDATLLLTFNRPERLNAWTEDLEREYFALLRDADADPEIRAVVVTGAGRGFCAGGDLAALKQAADSGVNTDRAPQHFPMTLRKPLIAAVNGPAVGLGLVEALYCDLRFATPQAKFGTAFARRGLIAESGVSWILSRLVGQGHAMDLLLSARIIDGHEALSMGLINRLCEPAALVAEALAYAQELARFSSPTSMSIIKAQVQEDMGSTFEATTARNRRLFLESLQRRDVREGVASYVEKRDPDFPPLQS